MFRLVCKTPAVIGGEMILSRRVLDHLDDLDCKRVVQEAFDRLSPLTRLTAYAVLVRRIPYACVAKSLSITTDSVRGRVTIAKRLIREHVSRRALASFLEMQRLEGKGER